MTMACVFIYHGNGHFRGIIIIMPSACILIICVADNGARIIINYWRVRRFVEAEGNDRAPLQARYCGALVAGKRQPEHRVIRALVDNCMKSRETDSVSNFDCVAFPYKHWYQHYNWYDNCAFA